MKILILGGGIGGLVASNLLSKRLGKKHEVTVVDRKTKYESTPSFPWLMMRWREPQQITRNLSHQLRGDIWSYGIFRQCIRV